METLIGVDGADRGDGGPAGDGLDGEGLDGEGLDGEGLDGEELARLALSCELTDEVSPDAVPLDIYALRPGPGADFLPRWYMPPVVMRRAVRWHRWAVVAVVLGLVTVDLFGLCITYGLLTAA